MGAIRIDPVETLIFNEAVNSDTLTSAEFRKMVYSKSSEEFLGSSVGDSLPFTTLVILECLHSLYIHALAGEHVNVWRRISYLEGSCSSNGFMGQGSMMTLFNLLISVS
jgi:hypothetical protein